MNIWTSFIRICRSAFRNKSLTLINITGLSVGLAVAMFLLVYLHFEFSYDKHFKDADRIYRMLSSWGQQNGIVNYPICFGDLAGELVKQVPEVESSARLYSHGNMDLKYENGEQMPLKGYLVDSTFINVFGFTPLYGELKGALDMPGKCVITRKTSERFFGAGVNSVGKHLTNDKQKTDIEVAAVIEDIPENTHFSFDILTKLPEFGWGGLEYYTYLKFRPGVDHQVAMDKCNKINTDMLTTRFAEFGGDFGSIIEPLTSLHTSDKASQDLSARVNKSNLIFIVLVTLFVLAIAICNFVSLYIIQGEKRATEICVRKTNGANRGSVIKMLFGETFFVTLISFLLAMVLYYACAGAFASLINFNMPENIGVTWMMWGNFILLFFLIAFVAGGYPAYYLSRFSPSDLIRKTAVRKYRLTAVSVVVQFSVVIFCVSALFVVWKQLDYVKNLPLGFNADNVMVAHVLGNNNKFESLQSDLLRYPEITQIAFSQGNPIDGCSGQGLKKQSAVGGEMLNVDERRTGPGYFEIYDIPIVKGRGFSDNRKVEELNLVVSESVVEALDLKDDPIGQKVIFTRDEPFTIIGVAKDIHYTSAHKKIGNLVYSAYADGYWTLSVRYEPGKYAQAKENLLTVLKKHYPETPVTLQLVKDVVDHQYWQDKVTARILMCGTVLAISLALLGLLALSGFVARQKRKEISVRRVLGAQVGEIVYDLNRYIIYRILPAIPIGIALSYYAMMKWLGGFQYAVTLEWWIFALSLALTMMVVLLTIMYQSLRAATANPVDALKSE